MMKAGDISVGLGVDGRCLVWRLKRKNGEISQLNLVREKGGDPMEYLGDLYTPEGAGTREQIAIGLLVKAKMYRVSNILYYSHSTLKEGDELHDLDLSCSYFAHKYLAILKFHFGIQVALTPQIVVKAAKLLFACQGYIIMNNGNQEPGMTKYAMTALYCTKKMLRCHQDGLVDKSPYYWSTVDKHGYYVCHKATRQDSKQKEKPCGNPT